MWYNRNEYRGSEAVQSWQTNSSGMISAIRCGNCWNRIYLDSVENGAEWPRITDSLSTGCSGFCEQEHRGGICRRAMGNGARYISAFADGVTKESGKSCLRFWWKNLILNG